MASPQLKARWNAFEALIYCYNWRDAKIKSLQRQIKGKIIILTPPPSILHNSCNKEDVNYLLLESVPRNLVLVMLTRGTKTIVAAWHCHPESFCAPRKFFRETLEIALENFRKVWKVCGWSRRFPDILGSFWMVWEVSG